MEQMNSDSEVSTWVNQSSFDVPLSEISIAAPTQADVFAGGNITVKISVSGGANIGFPLDGWNPT